MIPIKDSIRAPASPIVVYGLILINATIFLYQTALPPQEAYALSLQYALVPKRYFDPEWASYYGFSSSYWPFITGTFMHGGWLHILLNMWTLYIFGSSLEGRLGPVPFLAFYLACGVAASIAHAAFNQQSEVPALGASGAIAGVIGGYATTFPRARVLLLIPIVIIPFFFQVPALAFALIWFGLQFAQGAMDLLSPSMGGGIAWWAHIGGFLAGVALVPLFRFGPDRTHDENLVPRPANSEAPKGAKTETGPQSSPHKPGPWG